jgi:hypothetical protein
MNAHAARKETKDSEPAFHEAWAEDASVQDLLAYMLVMPNADHSQGRRSRSSVARTSLRNAHVHTAEATRHCEWSAFGITSM